MICLCGFGIISSVKKRTYISLFSCAGVGCYGFKMAGYQCIATNELLAPRIAVQRVNKKCKYESGYICGDATKPETHKLILDEIAKWRELEGLQQVDVVFATPPCQGMSTVNYKKSEHEQIRNSLVVEAIKMIKAICPKVFAFENVRAFMKSVCTDVSGKDMLIRESIEKNLGADYNIYWKVINFKDYGVPSSRPRTIVIGTSKTLKNVTPLQIFPTRRKEILLKDSIGKFARLGYGEKDAKDPLHFARKFPEYMLPWIKDLKEGETAFDNPDETKPYSVDKDGNHVINKGAYMGNKYRRLFWNRPGACIATRSDVMSSQDTIHPCDNRVLSIREIMTLMTIPDSFKWTEGDDQLTVANADEYLRENEGNIRRCIGEAVPTLVGNRIATAICRALDFEDDCAKRDTISDCVGAFEQIKDLDDQKTAVSVRFESYADFVAFAPQLAAYYSHVDHVSYDVIGLKKKDSSRLEAWLLDHELGVNVDVSILEINPEMKVYDVSIKNGGLAHSTPSIGLEGGVRLVQGTFL